MYLLEEKYGKRVMDKREGKKYIIIFEGIKKYKKTQREIILKSRSSIQFLYP